MNNEIQIKKLERKISDLQNELERQVERLSSFIEKNSDNIFINVSAIKQMPNIDHPNWKVKSEMFVKKQEEE